MKKFKGIYGIVLTPFKEDGSLDFAALERQVQKAVESESMAGLVVCGSTGEFSRLRYEENVEIMRCVGRANAGKKHFICGATAGDSYTANKYAEDIAKLGADGILLAPPYYFKLNDEEILEYYKDIAYNNSAKLPIIGYNIPQCTNRISVSIFERLLDIDGIKGFKNSWNDMQEITAEIALRDEKRKDVSMFTGLDACLYGTLSLGGDGIFSAISYLMPDIIDVIYSGFGKGDEALSCQYDLIKLINIVNRFTFPYGYRVLSDALGYKLGEGREKIPASIAKDAAKAAEEMYAAYKMLTEKYKK